MAEDGSGLSEKRRMFEARLAAGVDGALVRFALGKTCLDMGDAAAAVTHLARAVELEPGYSAAWAMLGKAHQGAGDSDAAEKAYASGIEVAEQKGELQVARQMRVFLKRLHKNTG